MLSRILKLGRRMTETATPVDGPEPPLRLAKLIPAPEAPEGEIDTDAMQDRAQDAVDALAGNHEQWLEADLQRLVDAWNVCKGKATPAWRPLFVASHNLKGMAASYGSPSIARVCTSLCTLLKGDSGAPDALVQLHVDACRAIHAGRERDGAEALAKTVCRALEGQVSKSAQAA